MGKTNVKKNEIEKFIWWLDKYGQCEPEEIQAMRRKLRALVREAFKMGDERRPMSDWDKFSEVFKEKFGFKP